MSVTGGTQHTLDVSEAADAEEEESEAMRVDTVDGIVAAGDNVRHGTSRDLFSTFGENMIENGKHKAKGSSGPGAVENKEKGIVKFDVERAREWSAWPVAGEEFGNGTGVFEGSTTTGGRISGHLDAAPSGGGGQDFGGSLSTRAHGPTPCDS